VAADLTTLPQPVADDVPGDTTTHDMRRHTFDWLLRSALACQLLPQKTHFQIKESLKVL
jgi:hypothetical protein